MSLKNLNALFLHTKAVCAQISNRCDFTISQEFKNAYAARIAGDSSFSRHDKATWLGDASLSLHSRIHDTLTFIPPIFFFVAKELVPLYKELLLYRQTLITVLESANRNLDNTAEPDCVPYINASKLLTDDGKGFLCKFVTDGAWWGKGRQIKRAQDFFESPLMQSSGLTQETQSEVARIAKQLAENDELLLCLAPATSLEEQFKNWYLNFKCSGENKTFTNSTVRHYAAGLNAVSAAQGEKDTQKWNGIYEYLLGYSPKPVFLIGTENEFESEYGVFCEIFKTHTDKQLNPQKWEECHKYVKGPRNADYLTDHGNLAAAFSAYREFLEWREGQKNGGAVQLSEDLLDIALQAFKEHRSDPDWACPPDKPDWGYVSVNKGTREYYDELKEHIDQLDEKRVEEMFLGVKDGNGHVVFRPMWSGSNGTGWDSIKRGLDTAPQKTIDWIRKYAKSASDVLVFATKADDDDRPSGFGRSVESELLMKFHPDAAIKCGTKTMEVLENLHLMSFKRHGTYDEWEYQQVLGIAADIKLRMDKLGITRTLEDNEKADYITVNEFIAWCKENPKEISKKCEVKKMKPADKSKANKQYNEKKLKVDLANAEDGILLSLAAALRTKPFAILAGHSGTGKSRMVRQLAYMTCAKGGYKALLEDAKGKPLDAPGNFCMVQVKPNWHDSTDLLGYYSELKGGFKGTDFTKFLCKAYAYPEVPFFVCLDEMNLAPVEQYFAEYLSAIESRKFVDSGEKDENGEFKQVLVTESLLSKEAWQNKEGSQDYSGLGCELTESQSWLDKHGLTIPRNLFVVGTVNMDESTNQFSRKVLDRAFTLEMTDANFKDFGVKNPEPVFDDYAGDGFANALLDGEVVARKPEAGAPQEEKDEFDKKIKNLELLKPVLAGTSFVVAYRFANEYLLYAKSLKVMKTVIVVDGEVPEPFDDMVLMKVLPRISGDELDVKRIFFGDGGSIQSPKEGSLVELLGKDKKDTGSIRKIKDIVARGGSYLSFWP